MLSPQSLRSDEDEGVALAVGVEVHAVVHAVDEAAAHNGF